MKFSGNIITSRQNSRLVMLSKLEDRKTRMRESLFRFDGVKLFCEALLKGIEIECVLIKESVCEKVLERANSLYDNIAEKSQLEYSLLEDSLFDRMCEESAPDGIICIARMPKELHRECALLAGESLSAGKGEKVILLESVRDPLNVGAIIRSALAFSVDRLIISRDCADLYNSKTVRSSMGMLFGIKIDIVDDITLAVRALRDDGRRVFAAALDRDARQLGSFSLSREDTVLIGNEGHGLSGAAISACDASIYIPMAESAESLNASVAASLFMWEIGRQG